MFSLKQFPKTFTEIWFNLNILATNHLNDLTVPINPPSIYHTSQQNQRELPFSWRIQEINCKSDVQSTEDITMINKRHWLSPLSRFWTGYFQLSRRVAYLWECKWKHLDCLNSGMWSKMQIKPNFQIYSQKVKQKNCNQTKRSNFHNKMPSF